MHYLDQLFLLPLHFTKRFVLIYITLSFCGKMWKYFKGTAALGSLFNYIGMNLIPCFLFVVMSANSSPSELVHAPGDLTSSISNRNGKPNCYLVLIGILSGLHAILTSIFIREFVNNKDTRTRLEQIQFAVSNAEKLQKFLSSKRLHFIWDLCKRTTLQCSRCLPG